MLLYERLRHYEHNSYLVSSIRFLGDCHNQLFMFAGKPITERCRKQQPKKKKEKASLLFLLTRPSLRNAGGGAKHLHGQNKNNGCNGTPSYKTLPVCINLSKVMQPWVARGWSYQRPEWLPAHPRKAGLARAGLRWQLTSHGQKPGPMPVA